MPRKPLTRDLQGVDLAKVRNQHLRKLLMCLFDDQAEFDHHKAHSDYTDNVRYGDGYGDQDYWDGTHHRDDNSCSGKYSG